MKRLESTPLFQVLAVTVTLLLLLSPVPLRAQAGEGQVGLPVGSPAPAVTLEDLDGNAVELLELVRGKPAVIEFWAIWCEQCEALQPEMDRVQELYGDQVNVLAVAVGVGQTVRRVQQHLAQHDPGYPFLWDGRGAAARGFEALTTAIVIILDADGRVAYTGVGPRQSLVPVVERLVGAGS